MVDQTYTVAKEASGFAVVHRSGAVHSHYAFGTLSGPEERAERLATEHAASLNRQTEVDAAFVGVDLRRLSSDPLPADWRSRDPRTGEKVRFSAGDPVRVVADSIFDGSVGTVLSVSAESGTVVVDLTTERVPLPFAPSELRDLDPTSANVYARP